MTTEVTEIIASTELAELNGEHPAITTYGQSTFYGETMYDDKARIKFIKVIVGMVRKCPEYARYRNFLLENLDMDRCSILSGMTQEECSAAGLEVHHAPLSLYDITELVLGQMVHDGVRVTTFAIANRVMAYHWRGYVGLVPLTETIHEAVHAGQIHVDPRSIYGNWQALIDENRNGLTEHLVEKLQAIVTSWMSGEASAQNARVLTVGLQKWAANPLSSSDLNALPLLPSDEGLEVFNGTD